MPGPGIEPKDRIDPCSRACLVLERDTCLHDRRSALSGLPGSRHTDRSDRRVALGPLWWLGSALRTTGLQGGDAVSQGVDDGMGDARPGEVPGPPPRGHEE